MSNSEKNTTVLEFEVTEEYISELREQGVSEEELPKAGTIQQWRRSARIAPRREHKIEIKIYLDGDVLDFLRQRSEDSYETQVNTELRKIMENEIQQKTRLRQELLNDDNFLREISEKLKAA